MKKFWTIWNKTCEEPRYESFTTRAKADKRVRELVDDDRDCVFVVMEACAFAEYPPSTAVITEIE